MHAHLSVIDFITKQWFVIDSFHAVQLKGIDLAFGDKFAANATTTSVCLYRL
ncbi:hypothetical protein [Shewanella sp.]|uniref:hypothetical protein n=1 Tax=Shewanella sp. TaxID=50422 RepID=UPI0026027762|nr:hypothetical protein [Shewanella sp.]